MASAVAFVMPLMMAFMIPSKSDSRRPPARDQKFCTRDNTG